MTIITTNAFIMDVLKANKCTNPIQCAREFRENGVTKFFGPGYSTITVRR